MGKFTDLLLARRDSGITSSPMVGLPTTGGLLPAGVTATTALGISAVWRSLDILSNGVSQCEWEELRGDLPLPPSRLVRRPQSWRTRREWTSLIVSTLALYDVAYLLRVGGLDSEGVPLGLWWVDPNTVQAIPTRFDGLLPPEEYWIGGDRVSADRVIVMRRSPQPGVDDALGGVIRLARVTFAAAIAAESYASRYWQSGGPPTTVLETDSVMDKTKADDLLERWMQRRAKGPDYAPILSSGLKAKSFGADPTGESAVEARREMVADVGRYFGIPTRILNAPTGDSETYSTSEMGNQDLVRYTLQNYIGAIEDVITDELPGSRRMAIRTARLTSGTQLAQAQALQLATGGKAWMTPEDARDVWGLPPLESPDALNPPAPVPEPASTGAMNE